MFSGRVDIYVILCASTDERRLVSRRNLTGETGECVGAAAAAAASLTVGDAARAMMHHAAYPSRC